MVVLDSPLPFPSSRPRTHTLFCCVQSWSIVGKDLISEVTCSEPYQWKDPTGEEWEFSDAARLQAGKAPFHVGPKPLFAKLSP